MNRPALKPADCWDWIKPDDVVRHALAAYYATCRYQEAAHESEPDRAPEDWGGRSKFAEELAQVFELKLMKAVEDAGITNIGWQKGWPAEALSAYTNPLPVSNTHSSGQ